MSFFSNSPIIGSKKFILVQPPPQISGSCFSPSAHWGYLYLIYHQFKKSSKIRSFLQKYSILCKIKQVIVIFFFFQLSLAKKIYKLNISFGNLKHLIIKKSFFSFWNVFFFKFFHYPKQKSNFGASTFANFTSLSGSSKSSHQGPLFKSYEKTKKSLIRFSSLSKKSIFLRRATCNIYLW